MTMIEKATHRHVVTAQHGFNVLEPFGGPRPEGFITLPVVAWVIAYELDRNGEPIGQIAFPVTTWLDDNQGGFGHIIEMPSGSIIQGGDVIGKDRAAALAYLQKRYDQAA
jgi:hypothetical protein